jgi:hypothetical protein
VVVLVAVAVLAAESGLFLLGGVHPPMSVSIRSAIAGTGLTAEVSISNGLVPMSAQVSLLPGHLAPSSDTTIFYLADSQFPSLYSPFSSTRSIGVRVGQYLELMGSPLQVIDVSAPEVTGALADHPKGTLAIVGTGVIPDTLYSANVSTLRSWIVGGGTLVWAGGPLGYSEGHPAPAGFVYDSLGWVGPTKFFGYPLSDPVNLNSTDPDDFPPTYGTVVTPLGADLGLVYTGTPSGANVSQVAAHGGLTLGVRTPGGPTNASPAARTSLAWVPLGSGGIWYFGGALFASPVGYIPQASVNLSEDIALVLGLGYRPSAGLSESRTVTLGSLASTTVTVSVADRSAGVVAIVRGQTQGALFYFFSETLATPDVPFATPPEIGLSRPTASIAPAGSTRARPTPR